MSVDVSPPFPPSPSTPSPSTEVRAAGGIPRRRVRRGARRRLEVALVHRPRYDDWSFPKGKCEPGESDEQTALREVEEETGLRCRLVEHLGQVRYRDNHGRPKVVRYWVMDPEGPNEPFTPNREVDELHWCSPDEAARLLTYEHDRELVDRLRGTKPVTVYLVRHAKAGSRHDWDGPDELRPLTKAGQRQAEELADRLADRGIATIVSSPYLRCRQTVESLAERLGIPVEIAHELAEGAPLDDARRILDKVSAGEAVVCSHGDVLGELLTDAAHHGVHLGDDRLEKGSTWAVEMEAGAIVAAEYLPAPSA